MLIQNDDQFLTLKTLGYIISIKIINNTIIKTIKIKKIIKIGNIIINLNNVIGKKIVLSIGFSKNIN